MASRKAWTPEGDALLRKLWATDMSIKQIAAQFPDRTPVAIQKHARYGLGLPDRINVRRPNQSVAWHAIQRELGKVPMADSKFLAFVTGFSRRQVLLQLRTRYVAGELHIAGWARYAPAGVWAARYALGAGVDALKPDPMPPEVVDRRYKQRASKDPAYTAARNARARARYAIKTGRLVRRDPLVAALYGAA
mgnify:CR=1 FL=1